MSASRLSLKSPPVIAGVVIALVVVVVLNLRTFGVGLPGGSSGSARQAQHPPAPVSLQLARESVVPLAQVLSAPDLDRPDLARDPFGCAKVMPAPKPVPKSHGGTAKAAPTGTKPGQLACSAVLLGGERPVALIAGKAYGVGDRVRGYQVQDIGATGVLLAKPRGKTLRLAVGPDSGQAASFKVVTSLRSSTDQGRTSLVEHR